MKALLRRNVAGAARPAANRTRSEAYIPPPEVLQRVAKTIRPNTENAMVTMPAEAYRLLLKAAIEPFFDEEEYLVRYPDVKDGIAAGRIASALDHFARNGFFEGRKGLKFDVDEAWYLRSYADVQGAIASGAVADPTTHFNEHGHGEGRAPNLDCQAMFTSWWALSKKQP